MKLIIIQGAPATGKTSLAKSLAEDLSCELFSKDGYKEVKFDELKRVPTVKEWSSIENAAKKKLYERIADCKDGECLIIESNFKHDDRNILEKLIKPADSIFEVYCYVSGITSVKRYYRRNKQGEWHKGHRASSLGYPIVVFINLLKLIGITVHKPLRLSEHTLEVDTTDFTKVNYAKILNFVKAR